MYQATDSGLLDNNQGDSMTIEATIATHTDGASDALVEQIAAPSAGSKLDVDRRAIEADIDRAIARTYSTLGR